MFKIYFELDFAHYFSAVEIGIFVISFIWTIFEIFIVFVTSEKSIFLPS
jgi:hypothetical protein